MRRTIQLCMLAFVFIMSGILTAYGASQYKIIDLSSQLGSRESYVMDVNDNGEAVGYYWGSDDSYHGFYWSSSTGVVDLGNGYALAINNLGQVVGSSNEKAFKWTEKDSLTYLSSGPAAGIDINESSIIAGNVLVNSETRMVTWAWDGECNVLSDTDCYLYAINNAGDVLGKGISGVFIRNYSGGMSYLKPLTPVTPIYPTDIDDHGNVLGNCTNENRFGRGVIWNNNGDIVRVLQPIEQAGYCAAYAMNNEGMIIGESSIEGYRACLWDTDGNVLDLGTLPGDDRSRAYQISETGWIAGYSDNGYGYHAVIWQPVPEPSSFLTFLSCIGVISGAILRRKQ